jgi:hypothetical protein
MVSKVAYFGKSSAAHTSHSRWQFQPEEQHRDTTPYHQFTVSLALGTENVS